MTSEEGNGTILLIEDDDAVREAVAEVCEEEGYRVLGSANGREAIEVLERLERPPSVIILDLMMPSMDGWQFLEWLEQEPAAIADTPVVLLSASPHVGEAAAQFGVKAYLSKPLSFETLIHTIERLCDRVRPPP